MSSYSFNSLPEVFATSAEHRSLVQKGLQEGAIRKIRRGLYTTNLFEEPEKIIKRNLWRVVSLVCPGTIVSHRTALETKPSSSGFVVVTGGYDRTLTLPGLQVRQMKGPGPLKGDARFIEGLHMSSRPRFLLECLSGKVYGEDSPFASERTIEEFLDRTLAVGEDAINEIRDRAREIAPELGMEQAFEKLEALIGMLLGTKPGKLTSPVGKARAAGIPYDPLRIKLFEALVKELSAWPGTVRKNAHPPGAGFENAAFFDAYFSNFIEGTEFEVEEAKEIVFDHKIPSSRPEDAHDILGTYRVVGDAIRMSTQVSGLAFDAFLAVLKQWHAEILQGRPDKRPGEFKEAQNRAGNTLFVAPPLVEGTLKFGFELGRVLRSPFSRAVYLLFLVAEVHPFDDGNGRIARAIANAELLSHGDSRILIPTVFRVEYLDSLRSLSREGLARTFVRMADQAQEFTADIDFSDFDRARAELAEWNAFESESHARLRRHPRDRSTKEPS